MTDKVKIKRKIKSLKLNLDNNKEVELPVSSAVIAIQFASSIIAKNDGIIDDDFYKEKWNCIRLALIKENIDSSVLDNILKFKITHLKLHYDDDYIADYQFPDTSDNFKCEIINLKEKLLIYVGEGIYKIPYIGWQEFKDSDVCKNDEEFYCKKIK